jgi:hypothetical protein
MSETITFAKSRKSGEWVVLVQPEKQFGEHLDAYRKIASSAPVNDEYSRVVIGKIRHSSPALNLITSEQRKAGIDAQAKRAESIDQIVSSAGQRQSEMESEEAAKKQEEHDAKIEEKNKIIDVVRKSGGLKTAEAATEKQEKPEKK